MTAKRPQTPQASRKDTLCFIGEIPPSPLPLSLAGLREASASVIKMLCFLVLEIENVSLPCPLRIFPRTIAIISQCTRETRRKISICCHHCQPFQGCPRNQRSNGKGKMLLGKRGLARRKLEGGVAENTNLGFIPNRILS